MKKISIIVLLLSLVNLSFLYSKDKFPVLSEIRFKENIGQISDQYSKRRPDVLFSGNTGELDFYLKKNGISYQLYRVDKFKKLDSSYLRASIHHHLSDKVPDQITIYRVDMNWLNSNKDVKPIAFDQFKGTENYYSEVCPTGVFGVKSFGSVLYQNLYPGIDLKWYEKNGQLKYDYIVSPGADHKQIQIQIEGADKIQISKNGELIISTPLGTIVEKEPFVTQAGKKLRSKWKLEKDIISFEIFNIDQTQQLIIDPVVRLWGSYYGGSGSDELWYTVTDASGNAYSIGETGSINNIATSGSHQFTYGGGTNNWGWGDAFLVKFDANGNRLWATYYGGSGSEFPNMININNAGNNLVMVGCTSTTLAGVIATPGSHQTVYAGGNSTWGDCFMVVFDPNGVRQWGTYYGGAGDDWVLGCSYDSNNNIYMVGSTNSTLLGSIATPGTHQTTIAGNRDAYLVKFNSAGVRQWGTYFGGTAWDDGYTCNIDASGNIFVFGCTLSSNGISTPGAYQTNYAGSTSGGWGDGIIQKFNSAGQRIWGTYYGGAGDDWLYNACLDSNGDLIISGTSSPASQGSITSVGAPQFNYGGGANDAFILKMNANGNRIWCTYFGGPGNDNYNWLTIDPANNIYLTGITNSSVNIATSCAYQQNFAGGVTDVYLEKFDPLGNRLWGTYFGGSGQEEWSSVYVDINNNIFLTGGTNTSNSSVITSNGCTQPVYGGGTWDGFIEKFSNCIPALPVNTTNTNSMVICTGKSTVLTVSANCNVKWFATSSGTTQVGFGNSFTTPTLSNQTTFYAAETSCGITNTRTPITVTVIPAPTFSILASDPVICSGNSTSLIPQSANSYTWVSDPTLNTSTPSLVIASPLNTHTYYLTAFDGVCTGTGSIEIQVLANPTINIASPLYFLCKGNSTTLTVNGATDYTWSPNTALSGTFGPQVVASPVSNIIYTIQGSNTNGSVTCPAQQQTVSIYVVPYGNALVSPNATVCQGQSAHLSANGGNVFNWWPIDNMDDPNGSEINVTPIETTIYTVSVSNNGQCPGTNTVMVKVNPNPFVDGGRDTTMNINEPIFIAAIGNGTLTWIEGENIVCKTCSVTQVLPKQNSCYMVEAINEFGCKNRDEVCVEITKEYEIYIPNCFTPDGNKTNELFKVYGYGITDMKLSVFDRWGKEMFTTKDANHGWDGTYKGVVCPEGIYIYKVDYKTIDGARYSKEGHVTILKN